MRVPHILRAKPQRSPGRWPGSTRTAACLAFSILSLVGCEAQEAEPDAGPGFLSDLWSPDFGPPPDDMPAEIRWMHGRMWCPGERPPRVLPDGSSECSHVAVPSGPARDSPENGCRAWPSRTTEATYVWAADIGIWITCNAERTVCCSGRYPLADPPPCDWDTWGIGSEEASSHIPTPEAEAWLTANNLQVVAPNFDPDRTDSLPQDLVDAFPSALNNCHPICKPPACGP